MTPTAERYTQNDEQRFILETVGDIVGRFLDIGACHPTCFSNTRALYERGWSGVMVEPSPGPLQNLIAGYGNDPRITLVGAAVSFSNGLVEFHATDDLTSTISPEHYDRWKNACRFNGKYLVPTITLTDIFERFGGDFAFVSIDAEGISGRLGMAFLETQVRPKCLCVEHDGLSTRDGSGPLDFLARKAGYTLIHWNGENAIYRLS